MKAFLPFAAAGVAWAAPDVLVYYIQAWALVWDEKPLFPNRIEVWANGPVVLDLYEAHRGQFEVKNVPGGSGENLTPEHRETVDSVVSFYGDKSANG